MIYSNFLKSVVLPIADKAMGTRIVKSLRQLKSMESYSKKEIQSWQNNKLQKLIDHAYNNTKYYKNIFDSVRVKPEDVKSIDDLNKIPKLTKRDIRENFAEIIPTNIKSIPHKMASTGGSTGQPLKYYLDLHSWSFVNASKIINWEKAGHKYGEKYAALGSTSLFIDKKAPIKHRIYYGLKNKIGLNGVNMSEDVCREYIELIKRKKIKFIYGYASSIYLLAKYVIENRLKVPIKVCFPTSEILTDHFRETIQQAFKCKIVDFYGAHDGGLVAFDHTGKGFEVTYNSILIHEGNIGNDLRPVLVTDLFNYAMPLINYDLGDLVSISKMKHYRYNGQVLGKVGGRTSEIITLENGNTITGPGFTILFKDIPVEYYQISKTGKNSIQCRIKTLPEFTDKHKKLIKETFRKNLGTEAEFELKFTDKFEFSESGKLKYFN